MKGSEILAQLPCKAGAEREDAILSAVVFGHYVRICWIPLRSKFGDHEATIFVSADALKLGEPGDSFRPNVSAATAQKIADELDCILPTTRICDLVYRQATARATPCLQPADPAERKRQGLPECSDGSTSMSDTPAMELHSAALDEKLSDQCGLVCNTGKQWVVTNRLLNKSPETAANYGWFDESAPYVSRSGLQLWQQLSTQHNDAHTDYSQVQPILVRKKMIVDGESMSIFDVGRDPELSGLITDEGIVKVWRQRSVPEEGEPLPPPVDPLPPTTLLLRFDRVLGLVKPYMRGEDVRAWQRFLSIVPDGVFGPQTDSATRYFQANHADPRDGARLVADGLVGPATLRAANEVLQLRGDTSMVDDFVLAKNYTNQDRSADIRHIVLHTAEIAEVPTAAEALAAWCAGKDAPRASWHYAVDCDSITQSVPDELIAWHAPGANGTGVGIELCGRASQSSEQWHDEFSQQTLERAARLVAYLCKKWNIPVRYVDREGLLAGQSGVTTHNEVSFAWHKTDHTDPGPHFPMGELLTQVLSS